MSNRSRVRHGTKLLVLPLILAMIGIRAGAQLPDRPRNLHVLPKDLTTDSVFKLMLGVADGLGVTCGFCHVGGDNRTWDSTNFASDAKPKKVTARAMFALTGRLNRELLPAVAGVGPSHIAVTCVTCHRGTARPLTLQDTLTTVLSVESMDSVIAVDRRIRARYAGGMAYDFREYPLDEMAEGLVAGGRVSDAVKLLEENARQFPASANVAFLLGNAYERAGDPQRAITQYHKVLSIDPAHKHAAARLRALTDSTKLPSPANRVR